jgi:DNA invertase Pin-like site-specific DNA recombinase
MAKPTRTALYIRTSTSDQDGAAQLHLLRQAAAARGLAPTEYVDLGHSGAKPRRPALDELRAAARRGEVRVLMVTGLDRLGRSLRDLLDLLDELTAAGCAIVSLRESVDMTTVAGRAFVGFLGVLAEFERGLIVERVHAGLAAARARGAVLGRPRQPGPDAVEVARQRSAGASWAKIAQGMGCTPSAARRALQRAA